MGRPKLVFCTTHCEGAGPSTLVKLDSGVVVQSEFSLIN